MAPLPDRRPSASPDRGPSASPDRGPSASPDRGPSAHPDRRADPVARPADPFDPGAGGVAGRGWRPGEALILSGAIGRGHDSVAAACGAALGAAGIPARTLDCMAMLGGRGSRAGTAVFRRLLSVPAVYDGFHFSQLRNGSWLPRALERAATRQLVPHLEAALPPAGGRSLVLSVFPTGVAAAAALKQSSTRPLAAVAVCTDACAHRMWVAPGTDLYIAWSPLAAATVRRYQVDAPVAVVPPAVRPQFYDAPARAVARERLGVPDDARCVLVMAGGWGLGPLAESADALAAAGHWVLAVAGANAALHARLTELSRRRPRVRPFAMTTDVPTLMAAADCVLTSPGQTCHEARVVGRRLVLLDVVPGHGRENTLHELETGGASATSPEPAAVAAAVGAMFDEHPALPPWPVASAGEWAQRFAAALGEIGVAARPPYDSVLSKKSHTRLQPSLAASGR